MVVRYGQVVLGPPGSGKTTYCKAMANLVKSLGRKVAIVNLDPANDALPYEVSVDINELIQVGEVMETKNVGPNGALVFCMEFLETNIEWLIEKLNSLQGYYFIFDFPGQAELYSHHTMVRNMLSTLEKSNIRLCAVYLVDSHYANDPGKYISAVMLALNSMMMMELPTVNVLSKVDSVEKYEKTPMGLEYYTEVMDLDYLVDMMSETPVMRKYVKLNQAMAEIVTDYSLVSFIPMSADHHSTVLNVMKAIDRANGYVYGSGEEGNIQRLLSCAVGAEWEHEHIGAARDEFMGNEEEQSSDDDLLEMIARQNEHRV